MLKQISLIFCVVFLSSVNLFARQSFNALVVGVASGDTITVMTKEKRQFMFQLSGIDAPEKEQDFGTGARQFLSNLVLNQTVTVSGLKKDCLDRPTASVTFKNKDLSLAMVESGNAWADSSCQTDEALVKKELSARTSKSGLWQNPNPVRPSDFREAKQQEQVVAVSREPGRRVFTGLAPTPPPIVTSSGKPSALYIGMSLDDFTEICGDNGKKSTLYSSEGYQSFSIDIPATKENAKTGCSGYFHFNRTSEEPIFKLSSAIQ